MIDIIELFREVSFPRERFRHNGPLINERPSVSFSVSLMATVNCCGLSRGETVDPAEPCVCGGHGQRLKLIRVGSVCLHFAQPHSSLHAAEAK